MADLYHAVSFLLDSVGLVPFAPFEVFDTYVGPRIYRSNGSVYIVSPIAVVLIFVPVQIEGVLVY